MRTAFLLSLAAVTLACAGRAPARVDPMAAAAASARLVDASGRAVGQVTFQPAAAGVLVVATLQGLPAGTHGFHVHQVGSCTPTFDAAGGHYNPAGREHGALNPGGMHAGDLPNIQVAADGSARAEFLLSSVTLTPGPSSLFDTDGSALVIHAFADDHRTSPSGNAGARIACGVVER